MQVVFPTIESQLIALSLEKVELLYHGHHPASYQVGIIEWQNKLIVKLRCEYLTWTKKRPGVDTAGRLTIAILENC